VFKTTNKSECSHIFTALYEAKLSFLFALLFFGKENEESTQYIILDEQSSSRQFFFFLSKKTIDNLRKMKFSTSAITALALFAVSGLFTIPYSVEVSYSCMSVLIATND
jgi:hypothetical protein